MSFSDFVDGFSFHLFNEQIKAYIGRNGICILPWITRSRKVSLDPKK